MIPPQREAIFFKEGQELEVRMVIGRWNRRSIHHEQISKILSSFLGLFLKQNVYKKILDKGYQDLVKVQIERLL